MIPSNERWPLPNESEIAEAQREADERIGEIVYEFAARAEAERIGLNRFVLERHLRDRRKERAARHGS
jgi:hypothetical protein